MFKRLFQTQSYRTFLPLAMGSSFIASTRFSQCETTPHRVHTFPQPIRSHIATHSSISNLKQMLFEMKTNSSITEKDTVNVTVTINVWTETCDVHNIYEPINNTPHVLEEFKSLFPHDIDTVYEWINQSLCNFSKFDNNMCDEMMPRSLYNKLKEYCTDTHVDEYVVVCIHTGINRENGDVQTSHVMVALDCDVHQVHTLMKISPEFMEVGTVF